jgi:hypothetical protein
MFSGLTFDEVLVLRRVLRKIVPAADSPSNRKNMASSFYDNVDSHHRENAADDDAISKF